VFKWSVWDIMSDHYKMKIEPIDFIMSNGLDFCSGNIIKYAARWDKKGEPLADLEKIISYANILIKEVRKG
tara:strand:+ start:27 stop:239 length:213 start_codon:yes stop_codon:yes gene_type:complete